MEKYKIQQIEDRSEIGDISLMDTKFKIIKKRDINQAPFL